MLLQYVPELHRSNRRSRFPSGDNGNLLLFRYVQGMLDAGESSRSSIDCIGGELLFLYVSELHKFDFDTSPACDYNYDGLLFLHV